MWLKQFLSADNEASSKRLVMIVLLAIYVVSHFLTMYLKIEIANKALVEESQKGMFWLILLFGGFITVEQWISKWQPAGPTTNLISQDVDKQTVITTPDAKTKVTNGNTKTTRGKS